jgi:hypothetical protein
LAEALTIDPYCGLALGLRNIYQNANFNPSAPVEESVRAARLLKQEKFNESKKNALLKKEAKESFSGRKRIMGFDGLNRIAI